MTANEAVVVAALVHPGSPQPKARARTVNGVSYTPESTKTAQTALAWAVKAARGPGAPDPGSDFCMDVTFHAKGLRRRDIDNLVKLAMDACTGILYADDSQVTELHARLHLAADKPRTELTVSRLPSRARNTA